jgi:hypothetical protein
VPYTDSIIIIRTSAKGRDVEAELILWQIVNTHNKKEETKNRDVRNPVFNFSLISIRLFIKNIPLELNGALLF